MLALVPLVPAGATLSSRVEAPVEQFRGLEVSPLIRVFLAEDQAAQLVAQALSLLRIVGGAKAFGKLEEGLLFLLPRFDAEFDEFHQNPVVAQALALGHALYLFGDGSGEGHAAADVFRGGHGIIIHQFGATVHQTNCRVCGGRLGL